ncbi:response regulator [Caldithrix abyssi]|uniref:Response regulator receiver protein n=1 Tax=Caldithrix abyssi DSM 13497 TaxID=880073 RepID=H1XYQ3_CALAY|nr:response regulator [Caldithrix abyssi]APF20567.1 response regulator receiver protein [Caldithrix abyssi DSM 13497]EHO40922.1 response regulator receiver protein [Caldithrix abyssi DSM 13497]
MVKVLVVDDAPDVREMISDFLQMEGYNVVTASNGLEALEVMEKENPQVAVVDIEMPRMNGLEFAKKVLNQNPDFPIVIISAYVEKYSMEYISKIGIKNILRKPIKLVELSKAIKELSNHKPNNSPV